MKNRILYGAIIVLFLVNGIQLYFSILESNKRPPRPREIIIRELAFDEEQIKKYDVLITEHQQYIRSIEEQITEKKTKLYKSALLENSSVDSVLFSEIAQIHIELEKIHIDHFQQIKGLCKGDQLQKFDDIVPKFSTLFRPPKPPKK